MVNRDDWRGSQEAFCKILSDGVGILIDTTWDPIWPELIGGIRDAGIPYIHVEMSIKPFVRAIILFLNEKGVFDAAFVFENEKGFFLRLC